MMQVRNGRERRVCLAGEEVCPLGRGTWTMGLNPALREQELRSLRCGIDLGLKVVDTAEMYGNGATERLVGEAIAGRRRDVFLVTKVLPSHAFGPVMEQSCYQSLARLGTDYIDLYLLHWRGSTPLEQTVEVFERLKERGMIRAWGVSNFDVDDLQELLALAPCAANQVLYNVASRGIEYDLMDFHAERGISTMAYSPLGQGGELLADPVLKRVSQRHETSAGPATPAQIMLAWSMRRENLVAIPKTADEQHLREQVEALDINLTSDDLAELDVWFRPPRRKVPLAVL